MYYLLSIDHNIHMRAVKLIDYQRALPCIEIGHEIVSLKGVVRERFTVVIMIWF